MINSYHIAQHNSSGGKSSFLILKEKLYYSDRDEIKLNILKLMGIKKIFAIDTSDK